MTALNVILQPGEAHIIADGAAMSGAKFVGHRTKILPCPHLRCAAGARGRQIAAEPILFNVSTYLSVEAMRRDLPADLHKRYGLLARVVPQLYQFDLVVAGVDEGGQAWAFSISSMARPGEPAFSLQEIEYVHVAPGYDDELVQRHLGPLGRRSMRSRDGGVTEAAVSIVEHQRLIDKDHGSGKGSKFVGCFAQIVSVHGDFIETSIIARWPDLRGDEPAH